MNQHILANDFLNYITSIPVDQNLNDWICRGKTDITYGSPNGGWDGINGFLFAKKDNSHSYVIRSIPKENASYIVIESLNIRGQLYNMDLSNPRICKENQGKTYLLESYRMTVGKGKKKEIEVENSFKSFGIDTNEITVIEDIKPNWSKILTDILEWGILREKVKLDLKNKIVEIPFVESRTVELNMEKIPLNQILYGPPGTGKTYATKELALKIANPDFMFQESWTIEQKREEIIKEYNALYQSGQIVFTTFHQSMSYEDFIEGIKPETKDNQVTYDVKDGVFKSLSNKAENNWIDSRTGDSKQLSFEDAFSLLKEEWDEDEDLKFPMKTQGKDYTIIGFTKTSIQFKKASGGTSHTLSIATLRDIYYKLKKVRSTGVGIYYPPILTKLYKYRPSQILEKKVKSYVLIIDEINRGNVSSIFGELITLLEKDKRIDEKEELRVKLPYSKEEDFGVPQNLYIIGTMNTADRSVEALDTALRRRFSFTEVMPDLNLLNNSKYRDFPRLEIMGAINSRLEILLDRNHTLGHAYFMKEDFIQSFQYEIIPLIQEYFYNDCSKIGLILGKGFVREKMINAVKIDKTLFAEFDSRSEIDIIKNYELIPFAEITDIESAFDILLS